MKTDKFKDASEYREMWNMLNTRENCLYSEIEGIRTLKRWLELRAPEIKNEGKYETN